MTSQVEVERKYSLRPGQEVPSLAGLVELGPRQEHNLVATYYDAPDYRLTRAKQVIRRRRGGVDEGWHLKVAGAGLDERIEFRAPLESPRVPAEFRQRVSQALAGAPLHPVAVLRTRRISWNLLDAAGVALAEVCFDQVSATVEGQEQTWREVEVELATGTVALLDQIEARFLAAGIRRADVGSKIARALGQGQAVRSRRSGTARMAVQVYLAEQIGLLQHLEPAVRTDAPDAVHRSRVATRRIRSTLRSYAGLFAAGRLKQVRAELRWHAEELGLPRDAEVLQERLLTQLAGAQFVDRDLIAGRVEKSLSSAHAVAHASLLASMDSDRYASLHLELEQLLAEPRFGPLADEPAQVLLPPMWERTVARVRELASHASARPGDLTRWHEVRKAAKRARYGAELLVPVLGASAEVLRDRWEAVTEAFGQLQDAVVAQQVIGDLAWEAVAAGLPRLPFDELRHLEDGLLRESLARGRVALEAALG